METTVDEFWIMIWEQDVTTIVMLTNLEENGNVCNLLECWDVTIASYMY